MDMEESLMLAQRGLLYRLLRMLFILQQKHISSLFQMLCVENIEKNIRVSTLCPGATQTEFAKKANIDNTLLFKLAVMKPERVAEIAYFKMMKGKRIIIPGMYNKLLVAFSKKP